MQITGDMIIGSQLVRGNAGQQQAYNPSTKAQLDPGFGLASSADVERACELAAAAFDPYRALPLEQRAAFLEAIAEQVLAIGPALIERAQLETGLPQARLEGERMRTVTQLRLFAKVVRDGRFLGATIDSALPDRAPPRPDLRLAKIGLGPVAVFGASNFPLAFSVAGGDTASALAAGCPVVVKAHTAHLGTSELVGRAVQRAALDCGLPEGVFSMVYGDGRSIGQQLVGHPAIKAVGFTGSRQGGTALMRTAASRPEPIPVYAEMSSVNPVFLLPAGLAAGGATLAQGFVDSLTMGVGQFCTNPGLVFGLASAELDGFVAASTEALAAKGAGTMLTAGIHEAYNSGIARFGSTTGLTQVARGGEQGVGCAAQAALYLCDAETFIGNPDLQDEVFGPAAIVVRFSDEQQLLRAAEGLHGQLTATVHAQAADQAIAAKLLPILERKAGRVLFNGFPTGVEVAHAMVHGGPFPATSDSRSTSVGATAIDRFLRPVCYQNVPEGLLPEALRDDNPLRLARVQDGELKTA
ncbi:aldehyde dehydrogenase (NADP(+)) [Massilia yuzhufengensis]|uniref:2,5-dioxovalerate dehydrogenase n=1 Tax=Massilia yuzhufengensis TaxID=1164594 RepID=A0A1I1RCR7_9BURK|nr:aldehyde dehydrogenase (NADP(+)) [Massilia yuzhufengensis]SFD32141.1 NADP-dependent aldehyde dehydrogenase [Massilia yuzhufengensis]